MAENSALKWSLICMIICITRTCFAADVSLDDVRITDPNINSIRYSTTATTTLTVQFSLGQTGGGVAVTGVTSYFKNEAGSVMSNEVANAGSATAAFDVTDIQEVEMPVIMNTENGEDCNEYLYLCFALQYDAAADDDTSNDMRCLALGKEVGEAGRSQCPDVELAMIDISDWDSTTISFKANLTQSASGVDVDGVSVFFSNDAQDVTSDAYTTSGVTATAADETIEGDITVVLPTHADTNCEMYTQTCFDLDVDLTQDTDHSNHQYCIPLEEDTIDCDVGVMVQHSVLLVIGSMLCVLLAKRD